MMTDSNNENKTATFSGNVYAELQPVKNLKIKSVFGVVMVPANTVVSSLSTSSANIYIMKNVLPYLKMPITLWV